MWISDAATFLCFGLALLLGSAYAAARLWWRVT